MYRFLLLRRPTVNSYGDGLVHVCASSAHNGPFGLKGIDMVCVCVCVCVRVRVCINM